MKKRRAEKHDPWCSKGQYVPGDQTLPCDCSYSKPPSPIRYKPDDDSFGQMTVKHVGPLQKQE